MHAGTNAASLANVERMCSRIAAQIAVSLRPIPPPAAAAAGALAAAVLAAEVFWALERNARNPQPPLELPSRGLRQAGHSSPAMLTKAV
ncbi:hypothetical protein E2R33_10710 [Rathayibacter toxicus]|uniref:hypothetical protein n=1 Tax=Rathayibacter toxicus TaxID=145458 RepID=UPI001C03F4A7|nr:hypothetical protein [Rathayibacter toxicus]QWL29022.1 hypothetical protein E2R33_10710 [Rathayibacter toxicus]QWL31124.1 hypothetical protein E2R34_10485 [Rathayibacter toxicus]